MKARNLRTIIATIGLMLAAVAGAQNGDGDSEKSLPEKAETLKFQYDVARAELQKPLRTLIERYRQRLETVSSERQTAGDLDSVVAVSNEIKYLQKRGDANPDPPDEEHNDLVSSRRIFLREKEALEKAIARKSEPLDRAFRENLNRIGKEYTDEGKLAEALVITNYTATLPAPGAAIPIGGSRKLTLKIQIDDISHLYLRGNEMWFDHTKGRFAAPGRHKGEHPTYIDEEIEWMPKWTGKVTERHDARIGLPTSGPPTEINLQFLKGRGSAEVIQQPDLKNDYTAKVEIRDQATKGKGFLNSSWIEFRLTW